MLIQIFIITTRPTTCLVGWTDNGTACILHLLQLFSVVVLFSVLVVVQPLKSLFHSSLDLQHTACTMWPCTACTTVQINTHSCVLFWQSHRRSVPEPCGTLQQALTYTNHSCTQAEQNQSRRGDIQPNKFTSWLKQHTFSFCSSLTLSPSLSSTVLFML